MFEYLVVHANVWVPSHVGMIAADIAAVLFELDGQWE